MLLLQDIGDSKRINYQLHSQDGGCPELITQVVYQTDRQTNFLHTILLNSSPESILKEKLDKEGLLR